MAKKPWTPEREAALVERAERGFGPDDLGPMVASPVKKRGRPSLSAEGGTSQVLNARIPADLHQDVIELARRVGVSASELTRIALAALIGNVAESTAAVRRVPHRFLEAALGPAEVPARGQYQAVQARPRVFLAYGGDPRLNGTVRNKLVSLGLDVSVGNANDPGLVLDRLESAVRTADLAVIAFGRDATGPAAGAPRRRSRQNAIFEYGYARAALGSNRVIVLYHPEAAIPSDTHGVVYVDVTKRGYLDALTQVLASLGLVVADAEGSAGSEAV